MSNHSREPSPCLSTLLSLSLDCRGSSAALSLPPIPSKSKRMQADEQVVISSGEDVGVDGGPSEPVISIAIKSQDGEVMHFKAKMDKPIKKLLTTYCDKKFLDLKVVRFLIDHRDFDHRKTIAQLGLRDNQMIVAVMPHHGG